MGIDCLKGSTAVTSDATYEHLEHLKMLSAAVFRRLQGSVGLPTNASQDASRQAGWRADREEN